MRVGGPHSGANWDLILLQYDAFQTGNVIALLEKLAASVCRTWTGLEAGGSRFLQNVSNYIPVTQQHHITGDLNLGPIFCSISPTYLLWDFALQDWPTLLPCRFFYRFAWMLPGLQDTYQFVLCVTVLMVETTGSCKMLIKSFHNPQQHITEYLYCLCKSAG